MQSKPITILSTRPLSETVIRKAALRDIIIETEAFIRTEPIEDQALTKEIQSLADRPLTAVFTSMNAVEAVATTLQGQQPSWKVFTLGTATTRIAKEKLLKSNITGGGESASALAEVIINGGDVRSVIFFCGDQRRDELPERLHENEIEVKELTVYKTINLPHRLTRTYDGIMFFSPSAVESFFRENHPASSTVLFAIGNTTATAIEQYASNKVIISDQPGKEALLDKVILYFTTINQHR